VEIVPGVDGLVHISDMSWTRRINHPSEVVQKGDEVEAVITSVDSYNQRISLSMKELLPNEWEEYANSHGVGDVSTGKITNVTDFGVFVELAPGVEGLCHISEIDRDEGLSLAEMFSAGQTVRCRILRVDWHESRIGLSMHSIEQDGADGEAPAEAIESAATDTAMAAALRAGGVVEEVAPAEDAAVEEVVEAASEEDVTVAEEVEASEEDASVEAEADSADGETEAIEDAAETTSEESQPDSPEAEVKAEAEGDATDMGEPEEEAEAAADSEGDDDEKKD
jgi:predicted RNA-binding protein with RPS1 domain